MREMVWCLADRQLSSLNAEKCVCTKKKTFGVNKSVRITKR
jgi:hypothetical protein